jgi:hypothetical protein
LEVVGLAIVLVVVWAVAGLPSSDSAKISSLPVLEEEAEITLLVARLLLITETSSCWWDSRVATEGSWAQSVTDITPEEDRNSKEDVEDTEQLGARSIREEMDIHIMVVVVVEVATMEVAVEAMNMVVEGGLRTCPCWQNTRCLKAALPARDPAMVSIPFTTMQVNAVALIRTAAS